MNSLQTFNVFGDIHVYNNNIIIDAHAVDNEQMIVEVESYEADVPEVPPDTEYHVHYVANLAIGGRAFKFLMDGKQEIVDHPQVDKAIRAILQMFRAKHAVYILQAGEMKKGFRKISQ